MADLTAWKTISKEMGLSEQSAALLKTIEAMFRAALPPDAACAAISAISEVDTDGKWTVEMPIAPRTGLCGSLPLASAQAGVPGDLVITITTNNADDLAMFGDAEGGAMMLVRPTVPDNENDVREIYIELAPTGPVITPEEGATWGQIVSAINSWSVANLSAHQPIASLSDPDAADIVYNSSGSAVCLVENSQPGHCAVKGP